MAVYMVGVPYKIRLKLDYYHPFKNFLSFYSCGEQGNILKVQA